MMRLILKTERRSKFLFLLCIGACLLPISNAQIKQPSLSQQSPIWFSKPKQVGYNLSTSTSFRPTVGADRVKIQFLDDQRLALAWLTLDEIGEGPIGHRNDVPTHLHLTILDAHTGQQIGHHVWPCSSKAVNLAYTASGQWLVSSDKTVTLYSASFDEVRHLDDVVTEPSKIFVSPSGRSFLSRTLDSHGERSSQLRDSTTLEVLDSWNDALVAKAHLAYSDHFVLAYLFNSPQSQQLYLRKLGRDWKPYSISVPDNQPPGQMGYGFLNDDTIAGFAGPKMAVETVERVELFIATLPEDSLYVPSWSVAATSTRGERFAVILDRSRGLRSDFFDLYPLQSEDRVVVYSISKRSAIFSLKVKGISPWLYQTHAPWNVIALSPDGHLLGIVSDEGVGVYLLPPTDEEKQKSVVAPD
jgi:hypothetical protein